MRTPKPILVLLLPALLSSVWFAAEQQVGATDWTFMVFMCGDNNLELATINNFLEMAQVGSDANVKIVVEWDRSPVYDTSYGNWSNLRRGIVYRDTIPDSTWGTALGDPSMGWSTTLSDFVIWAMQTWPATRYALVLNDHGSAFNGVLEDDTSGGDKLTMVELRTALQTIQAQARDPDLIGFDACLMGAVEVAYEIRQHATVMVASEQTLPLHGFHYDTILADLVANPAMSPVQLGQTIVSRYHQSWGSYQGGTVAASDLTQMDALAGAIDSFARILMVNWNQDPAACASEAGHVLLQLDSTIFAEAHGTDLPGSHGLHIFLPVTNCISAIYTPSDLQFVANTSWANFLTNFLATMGGSWLATARLQTQQYDFPECGDLYDYCLRLVHSVPALLWADFYYSGMELGTFDYPYHSLLAAVTAATAGQTICIKRGISSETLTINKPLTLRAAAGPVTVGRH